MVATSHFAAGSQNAGNVVMQIQTTHISLSIYGSLLIVLQFKLASRLRYRHVLLQREVEQGLARNLHLVSLGDDVRTCASSTADGRTDPRTFTATGNRT